ncbi:MAG: glycosyltransferase [Bradyrhizobium sp.]|nr:glycosyltransferase [Bradyrhizobium sp.]
MELSAVRVSAILPIYNGEKFLAETLESVLSQNFSSFEIIIVDDGSNDGSAAIIEKYRALYPDKFSVILHETNRGVCATVREALSHCCGEFIFPIGHDDIWHPDYLTKMVFVLDQDPTLSAVFASVRVIDADGTPILFDVFEHNILNEIDQRRLVSKLLGGNFLCVPASGIRRTKMKASDFGINNELLQDHELWLNLSVRGGFAYVPGAIASYRRHEENLSSGLRGQRQLSYEMTAMLSRFLLSKGLEEFLLVLTDDDSMELVECCAGRLYHLSQTTAPALPYLISIWLEHLSEIGVGSPSQLDQLRSQSYLSSGLFRKYLQVGDFSDAREAWAIERMPMLSCTDRNLDEYFEKLLQFCLFRDYRRINIQQKSARKFMLVSGAEANSESRPSLSKSSGGHHNRRPLLIEIDSASSTFHPFLLPEGPDIIDRSVIYTIAGLIEDSEYREVLRYAGIKDGRLRVLKFVWSKVNVFIPLPIQRFLSHLLSRAYGRSIN